MRTSEKTLAVEKRPWWPLSPRLGHQIRWLWDVSSPISGRNQLDAGFFNRLILSRQLGEIGVCGIISGVTLSAGSQAAIASWTWWPKTTKQRAFSAGGSAGGSSSGRSARGQGSPHRKWTKGAARMSRRTAARTGASRYSTEFSTELSPSHALGLSPALDIHRRGQMVLRQNKRRGLLLGDDRGCTTPLARRMMSSREKIT